MTTISNRFLNVLATLAAAAFIVGGSNAAIIEAEGMKNVALAENPETRDIVITRVFDAPVEAVWKAWTDPEYLMRWWGPKGFTGCQSKIDFREGGSFLFCMRAPKEFQGGQDFYTAGVYKKIVHLKLIEFTQRLADKEGNRIDPAAMGMPVDFPKEIPSALAFKRVGNKTELTASESGWAEGQMRDLSEAGLNECLDKLAAVVARHK